MRVKIDRDACQTAATCLLYQLDPDKPLYELDDDSIAILNKKDGTAADGWVELADLAGYDAKADAQQRQILIDSAKNCPFNAIIVEDDDGTVVWPKEVE